MRKAGIDFSLDEYELHTIHFLLCYSDLCSNVISLDKLYRTNHSVYMRAPSFSINNYPRAFFFFFGVEYDIILSFPGGSVVKNLPAMQETQVQSLRREDALEEEGMTTPPWVFLPGELNGQRILVSYSPWGREESDITSCHSFTHDVILHTYFSF